AYKIQYYNIAHSFLAHFLWRWINAFNTLLGHLDLSFLNNKPNTLPNYLTPPSVRIVWNSQIITSPS
ncbi:hypothetical protein L9F63_015076, partial [Diploptera punctata]